MNDPGDEHAEPAIAPPDRVAMFARCYRALFNETAIMFGGPLYLVGSILTSETPGDIDLRLQLDRATCILYWGEKFAGPSWEAPKGWIARKREELKQSRRLTKVIGRGGRGRVDFQFQCTLFSGCDDLGNGIAGRPIMRDGKPHLRVDEIPDHVFVAGRGDP